MDEILPNLYLGNHDAAQDPQLLKVYEITSILVCSKTLLSPFSEMIQYKQLNIADDIRQKIRPLFDEVFEWIEQQCQKGKVFVHCWAGISRSPSLVIAYLMRKHNMSAKKALVFVKKKRPAIDPNQGFFSELEAYEKELIGKNLLTDIQK